MASRPAAPSLVKLKHRCRRALFCRQHREVIVAASCILKVDRDIRTNDVSAFAQAISERRQRDLDTHTLFKSRRPDREPADHRYRRLLRSRGAGCRAVRDGAVPVRGARRRVALDLGGGAGAVEWHLGDLAEPFHAAKADRTPREYVGPSSCSRCNRSRPAALSGGATIFATQLDGSR